MAPSKPTPKPLPDPDVDDGIKYWAAQPANYDGVLGGFGTGSLPRVDALTSRQFLMHLLPELCTVPSAVHPLSDGSKPAAATTKSGRKRRTRVLDVGAGVGRVTADALLHLFDDVVLVEPVEPFIAEAVRRGKASASGTPLVLPPSDSPSEDGDAASLEVAPWKGIRERTRSVTFVRATLQDVDPLHPVPVIERVGYEGDGGDEEERSGFDVVWCQWCLGALSDADLVAFFRRARAALRDPVRGLLVVKENTCSETGGPRAVFDESDSSLTRSDLAWKECFKQAGLTLIYEQLQKGFPDGLYPVKMYALR